jgi:metallo-beta-lactamase class B
VKSLIAAVPLFFVSALKATEPGVSIYPLVGSIYVMEDSHFAKTNCGVYIGTDSVTLNGAGWSPDVAELLAQEIPKVTDKPIKNVVVPDHDPEYSGGISYWKRIGANVVSTTLTKETLKSEWTKAVDFTREHAANQALCFAVSPNGRLDLKVLGR